MSKYRLLEDGRIVDISPLEKDRPLLVFNPDKPEDGWIVYKDPYLDWSKAKLILENEVEELIPPRHKKRKPMDFRAKKWLLMMRDPLCQEFDQVLHDQLLSSGNEHLYDLRMKLSQEIREKWNAGIYVPEAFTAFGRAFEEEPDHPGLKGLKKENFVGPFKWWSNTGDPYRSVVDGRESGMPMRLKDGKFTIYSFEDDHVIYCEPHKIPIIIDPSGLTINDAKKVKEKVWEIVKNNLEDKTQCDTSHTKKNKNKWNPSLPPKEPKKLAKMFHLREETFNKYLKWYDLKTEQGLTFRLIAIIEKGTTPEKQQATLKKIIKSEKKPKIGTPVCGESTIRRGFNLIYRAIHRTDPPTREQDIQTQRKYNCPEHGWNCPPNCSYLTKWTMKFNDEHKEISLKGTQEHIDAYKPSSSGKRKGPPKKDE